MSYVMLGYTSIRRRSLPLWFSLALVWLSLAGLRGAERLPNGRDIYRQRCVKCHGRAGEGVKGKYSDPLQGDWSIERLKRVIQKTMPEDAPKKCPAPEAEAVARYIYDAFYSREARDRNHPARVELARLTNRQYINTIADLLGQFAEKNQAPGSDRGLRAAYYNARNFNGGKKLYDRVDPQINFNYGEGAPEGVVSNEFSIQWRGSIIADETGMHEFIVKTPLGMRLWVNDEETPLIDDWVASGDLVEHKASLRLIGGRAYPLRLDCFRFKDKTASIALVWKPPHSPEQLIPARNLAPDRVSPLFVVNTPFPPDDSSVGYERGVAVSKEWDEATTHAALEVAAHVVKHLNRLSDSKPADTNRLEKVETFCAELAGAAFRRPLTSEQKQSLISAQFKAAPKMEDAVKRVVLVTLKSPRFLYLGLEGAKPDDFDAAARLSFGLWDSLPDTSLAKAASQRALRTKEQVDQQAQRMLADPRARAKMRYFLQQWLQMDRGDELAKDLTVFPGFTPEIVADLRTSLNVFLDDIVWSESSDYRKLLLADYLFLNGRLASFYGVSTNTTNEFVRVSFSPNERSGVLTHPYLLSAFSYQKTSSPIHRGVFLTRNIVGRALKPPPMAVSFKDSDFAPNLTMREKVVELPRPQACQSCHSVINPLGFSLEQFDAVGRFRVQENGKAIDPVSEYATDDGQTVRLAGPRDVAQFAAGSEQAQIAFIEQLFHQLVKQPVLAYGKETMARLRQSFAASEFNIQKLALEIITLAALHDLGKPVPSRKKSS